MQIPKESTESLLLLRKTVHREQLNVRRIEHIICGLTFESIYTVASASHKAEVIKLIEALDVDGLLKWIKKQIEEDIGDYNIRTLRYIASTMGVHRYSFLTKAELLTEIIAREKARTPTEVQ